MSETKLTIGIVGFGNFGQFLGKRYASQGHRVIGTSRRDYTSQAKQIGCEYVLSSEELMEERPEIVVFCTSIVSLDGVLKQFPLDKLKEQECIVVDVLSVKLYAKELLLKLLPEGSNILCTHPMFGPVSGVNSWEGLSFMYDNINISNTSIHFKTMNKYIDIYRNEGCKVISMSCEKHDLDVAGSQFLTHITGRVLDDMHVQSTLINTNGFNSLLDIKDSTVKDSFDLFYGLYKYNPIARSELTKLELSLSHIRKALEKKESEEQQQQKDSDTYLDEKHQVLNGLAKIYCNVNVDNDNQDHNDFVITAAALSFINKLSKTSRRSKGATHPDDIDD